MLSGNSVAEPVSPPAVKPELVPTAPDLIAGWLPRSLFGNLEAFCDTLLPSLEAPRGSTAEVVAYYARRAADLHVAERLAGALAPAGEGVHADLRRFLGMLSSAGPSVLFAGVRRPFAELDQADREHYLTALANSRVATFRTAYQGIKRLACSIFYTALDADGSNPNWEAVGYRRPAPPPSPVEAPIRPLTVTSDRTLVADVVVIGSGAGGAVVAGELASTGRRVVVLEQGGYNRESDFTHLEQQANSELFLNHGALATDDLGVLMMSGSTLGGSTVVNWMTCFRIPEDVGAEWEQSSGFPGWFTNQELGRSFACIEDRLGVNADDSPHNRPNAVLYEGAKALGHHAGVISRNAFGCEGKCDGCNFGCREGHSQSTLVTFLEDAVNAGAQVVVRASADRVLIRNGRAAGVVATVEDPSRERVHTLTVLAGTVVAAAGAINTPALLLRSGIENPNLGRHLHLHPTTVSVGLYPEPVNAWEGVLQSAYSDEFTHLDRNYGFKLEAAPGHPGLFALARPWAGGRDFREQMTRCAHLAPIIIVVRDRGEGEVRLDERGQAVVRYRVTQQDRAHVARGLKEMARIHYASGADEVMSLQTRPTLVERSAHSSRHAAQLRDFDRQVDRNGLESNRILMFSAHQMGSCRMGEDPRRSVTDAEQRVHGVSGLYICDSSVFPAACGVNPMLPVMGLAHRASQHIKAGS